MANHTSKPTVRLKSMANGPLRSNNNYQFGFYDIGVLRHALETSGAPEYRIATMAIPSNPFERAEIQRVLSHPSVQYAIVDKNKIVACIIDSCDGWMSVLSNMGFVIKGGGKTAKRMKSIHRATLINAHFDHLNIHYVNPTDFTRYNFTEEEGWAPWICNPETLKRLLDGGFVISSRLIQAGIQNLPVYEPHNTLDSDEYYYDPTVKAQLVHFLATSRVFNVRLLYSEGTLKGNAIVVDNLPEGVDVITSRENLKTEVLYNGGFRFLAEPQGPKSRVITDDQTVINFPKLFPKADMQMWLEEEYEKMFKNATEGKLLTNWKSVFLKSFSKENQDIEDMEAYSRISYVGYRWVSMGLSITDSPWLFETLAVSHAKPLQKRIPIPCSVYEQIIPESLARMAGYDIEVEEGTIRRLNEIGVHVVNDFDWLEMYESHGGHDQDDFFKLFYREAESGPHDGSKIVIAVRSPNGYGEHSIFRYVEGEWFPTWTKANGEEISFPIVNGRNWPVRLSEAVHNGTVRYAGLPSTVSPSVVRPATDQYCLDDVMADIDTAMNGGNVGRYVNASMLHSMVMTQHRSVQLCSLESAIDACTQTSDPADRIAIDAEAESMVAEVLASGRPIDRDFWYSRFRTLAIQNPQVLTYEGKITQLNSICAEQYRNYVLRVSKYAQQYLRPSDVIHKLGQRLYFHALPVLRNFRMNIFNANATEAVQSNSGIKRSDWEYLYVELTKHILSFERVQDQHDFVLSLYSASINVPTSNGKVTDQIVLNRIVFPFLEKALQHYGIANRVTMHYSDGEIKMKEHTITSWSYPDQNGTMRTFHDVFDYQNFHAQFSPIVFSNVNKEQSVHRDKAMF